MAGSCHRIPLTVTLSWIFEELGEVDVKQL
jgi:hypothetical protein